jgi:hypothetical protein
VLISKKAIEMSKKSTNQLKKNSKMPTMVECDQQKPLQGMGDGGRDTQQPYGA